MTGRAQLLLVIGFSTIFLLVSMNFASISNRTRENSSRYYYRGVARNIANSGMNIALERIYEQNSWNGTLVQNFAGGTYSVSAVEYEVTPGVQQKTVTAVGAFEAERETTVVVLQRPTNEPLAKYAYFIQRPLNNWEQQPERSVLWYWTLWHGGDSISGPLHSGTYMFFTNGDPVFWDRVTCGLDVFPWNDNPKLYGGLRTGIGDIEQVWSDTAGMRANAQAGGRVIADTLGRFTDSRLIFNSDGTVTYATRVDTGTHSSSWPIWSGATLIRSGPEPIPPDGTAPLSTFAPNGLIYAPNGNIHVEGTLSGRVTVVANTSSMPNSVAAERSGNVFLDGDLVYANDPRVNPGSTDALGAVSFFDSWIIKNDGSGQSTDIVVNGAFFNLTGEMRTPFGSYLSGFSSSSQPVLRMLGGSFSNRRNSFYDAWFGASSGVTFPVGFPALACLSYQKRIAADPRFTTTPPPFYPTAPGKYRIVTWYE
jgi:hypothetical protein